MCETDRNLQNFDFQGNNFNTLHCSRESHLQNLASEINSHPVNSHLPHPDIIQFDRNKNRNPVQICSTPTIPSYSEFECLNLNLPCTINSNPVSNTQDHNMLPKTESAIKTDFVCKCSTCNLKSSYTQFVQTSDDTYVYDV